MSEIMTVWMLDDEDEAMELVFATLDELLDYLTVQVEDFDVGNAASFKISCSEMQRDEFDALQEEA